MKTLASVAVGAAVIFVVKRYFRGGMCHSQARLDGKTVIVTGSNIGIGLETARDLSRRGARVIMACRNVAAAQEAADEISKQSGGQVEVYKLDLSSLKSVRDFAAKVRDKETRLDILINNAGLGLVPHTTTEDGFELTIATNHLGPFLLTNLLLDLMAKCPDKPARIVNVSSKAHLDGKIHIDDLNMTSFPYGSGMPAYRQSKLANILFSRELAKRTQDLGINVYSLHPGVVRTGFARYVAEKFGVLWILMWTLNPLNWLLTKNSAEGAQTTIFCAVDESLKDQSGKYYADCKEKAPHPNALDDEMAIKLWNLSAELVKL